MRGLRRLVVPVLCIPLLGWAQQGNAPGSPCDREGDRF